MNLRCFIHIEALSLSARVGILDQEYLAPQRLIVDFRGQVAPARWPVQDLADSVSYAAVAETITAVVDSQHWPLLEELAEALRQRLFSAYPLLEAFDLSLKKPDILPHAASVGFSIAVSRS